MNSYLDFASPAVRHQRGSVSTIVVIDCSPSMQCADWQPSRLQAAKEATMCLIERKSQIHPDDAVGIVSYGGDARTIHPPVTVARNRLALIASLDTIKTIFSTNLAVGLHHARAVLRNDAPPVTKGLVMVVERLLLGAPRPNPVPKGITQHIVCLSDGQSVFGNAVRVADEMKQDGVLIDSIGISRRERVNERELKAVASPDRMGRPRYRFIGDMDNLVQEFHSLAGHIRIFDG